MSTSYEKWPMIKGVCTTVLGLAMLVGSLPQPGEQWSQTIAGILFLVWGDVSFVQHDLAKLKDKP